MFNNVLVATDFSAPANRATEAVARVSRIVQPRVNLLHVVAPLPAGRFTPFVPIGASPDGVAEEMRERARERLEAVRVEHFSGVPNVASSTVVHRHAAAAICEAADAGAADLVALGTHGLSGVSRALYGSVAERVVRHANASVLVVHPDLGEGRMPPRHILCATDFSTSSMLALDTARDWANAFDAELTLLHVVDDESRLTRPLALAEPDRFEQHLQREAERATRELDTLRSSHFPDPSAKVAIKAVVGMKAADTICTEATFLGIDLVVLSTLGRTGLSRWLIGSVAERVVRDCRDAAVLVARPHHVA